MSSSAHGSQRPILVNAVREIVRAAQSERALLSMDAPEREFYLGVEAAADEVLHPELAAGRAADWPGRESAPFREGYLQMSANLAAALGSEDPPLRLLLPDATAAVW